MSPLLVPTTWDNLLETSSPFFDHVHIYVQDGLHQLLFQFKFRRFYAFRIFDNLGPCAICQLPLVKEVRDIGADQDVVDLDLVTGLQGESLDATSPFHRLQQPITLGLKLGRKLDAVNSCRLGIVFVP